MGERVWHLARARHHKDAADFLRAKSEFLDWAVVALFYSALQYIHALLDGEPGIPKDEAHPRKHSAPPLAGNGGRGVNQLVADLYPSISRDYRSLFEASLRTRYDIAKLGEGALDKFVAQHARIEKFVMMMLMTRPPTPTDEVVESLLDDQES